MFNLFSSPVLKEKILLHQEFKNTVLADVETKFYQLKQKKHWAEYCDSWQDNFDIENSIICKEVESYISRYFCILGCSPFKAKFECWINVHNNRMYQECHDHVPSIISGIYYINFDKSVDKGAVFLHPNSTFADMCAGQGISLGPLSESKYCFPVEEGDLIIFPSTLKHYVPPSLNRKDGLRVSLSFNIKKT
tara:strand:- start:273 stop:848 length:576 start_codon:yes stop_codon:yes gene_type:complete